MEDSNFTDMHQIHHRGSIHELGITLDSPSWFLNEIEGSDKLQQVFHDAIRKEGVPFNRKFEGTTEDLVKKLDKAYEGIPQKHSKSHVLVKLLRKT